MTEERKENKHRRDHEADVAFIKALAELLRANDLTQVEVKREFGKDNCLNVRVERQVAVANVAPQVITNAPLATPAAPAASNEAPKAPPEDPANHPGAVTSPMVGTVYLQAEPGAAPFITVGASIKEGQTLLIVEAMKTMNTIPAPRSGTIKRILVEDGSAVEYGAPLVIIE